MGGSQPGAGGPFPSNLCESQTFPTSSLSHPYPILNHTPFSRDLASLTELLRSISSGQAHAAPFDLDQLGDEAGSQREASTILFLY
jgi:hypothetical protein